MPDSLSFGYAGALEPLPMDPDNRQKLTETILRLNLTGCLLCLVISGHRVATLVRSKLLPSLHALDLNLVINQVTSFASFRSGQACWSPVTLPLFQRNASVHMYVQFLDPDTTDLALVCLSQSAENDHFYMLSRQTNALISTLANTRSGEGGNLLSYLALCASVRGVSMAEEARRVYEKPFEDTDLLDTLYSSAVNHRHLAYALEQVGP